MARRRPTRNSNRKWLWRAALVALIVLPAIAWLLPRRVHDIVSIDGRHRWEHADAPPRQRIVWQPAEKLPTEVATAPAGERANFARPQ